MCELQKRNKETYQILIHQIDFALSQVRLLILHTAFLGEPQNNVFFNCHSLMGVSCVRCFGHLV